MKVLVTSRSFGKVSPEPLQILKDAGLDVIMMGSDYTDEKFAETITDCDALIIGAHKFHPELMAKCKKLQIVAKHGAGLDNLDIPAAKALGVTVTNVPAMNANAVADLTVGLMLDVLRGISKSSSDVKNGIWRSYIGKDMYAKTLGLIGFGNIAKNVARRAKGFSMKIIAYDPYITDIPEEFKGYVRMGTLEELLKQGDIVSVHIPLSPDTLNLLCKDTMLLMKKGAFLINTSRGGIVNEKDLYELISSGHLGGAAMDVTQKEPMAPDDPLLSLDNVTVTPHIGMYSFEAINAVSMVCAQNIAAKLKGGIPEYIVV